MKYLLFALLISVYSCTTFSKYSVYSKKTTCAEENKSFHCYTNDSLHWNYTSFGGFISANKVSDFRKLKVKKAPKFKNVLLYGYSPILKTDYYILLDNNMYPKTFVYKDTLINNRKLTVAVNTKIYGDHNKNFLLGGLN